MAIPEKMKAAIWTRYGPPEVLRMGEAEVPVPKDDEVLVRVTATNVFAGDCELRRFEMHTLFWLPIRLWVGVFKPRIKILGQEFAGVVESVGKDVTRFKPGDRIYSPTAFGGSYAEYYCCKDRLPVTIPDRISDVQAAPIAVGGLNALHFLRVGRVAKGQKILLFGAGGGIGTMAIQIAKAWGAEVTVVDSGDKLEKLRGLGADYAIDYTVEDFTSNEKIYDAIIDIVGKSQYRRSLKRIKPGGYYIHGNASTVTMIRRIWSRFVTDRKVQIALASYGLEDMETLRELVASGAVTPLIDRSYSLDQVVEAHRYVESGKRVGNVVLDLQGD